LPEPYKAKEQLDKISTSSRELVDSLQDIIWVLNPKNDTLENLSAYIREYALKYFEPLAVKISFKYPEEFLTKNLSEEKRRNVFLTVKESLHNIAKHAWCNEINISITELPQQFEIIIEDDGKGFDSEKVRLFANGLKNMKNRIEQVGGKFQISSKPGQGTTTKISMPV
jgi:signal transduction histidine kinase